MAFNSIEALQRHIMRHFKQTPSPPLSSEPLTTNMSPPNVRTIEGNSSVASALGPVAGVVESTEDSTSEIGSLSSSNSFQISKGIVSRVNPEAVLSTPLTGIAQYSSIFHPQSTFLVVCFCCDDDSDKLCKLLCIPFALCL